MTRSTVWVAGVLVAAAAGAGLWFAFGGALDAPGPTTEAEEDASGGMEGDPGTPGLAGRKAPTPVAAASSIQALLHGRVIDGKGKPVEGVRVTARRTGPVRDENDPSTWGTSTTTEKVRKSVETIDAPTTTLPKPDVEGTSDATGGFELSIGSTGIFEVVAWPEPPRHGGSTSASVASDAPPKDVVVRVWEGHPFRGRVLGAGDAPVAAVVTASVMGADGESSAQAPPVETSRQTGDFGWPALADGKGMLTVKLPGRGSFSVPLATPALDVVIIRVPGGGTVRGKVSDALGAPVAHADVVVSTGTQGKDSSRNGSARGKSGPDGTYRIEGAPAGKVTTVFVQADGFLPRTTPPPAAAWVGAELKEGQELVIDLVLQHGGTVTGRVVEPGGTVPVTDAEVTLLLPQNRYDERAPSAVVDKEGRYRIEDVPLGRYVAIGKSPTHYMPALAGGSNQVIQWGPDGPIGGSPPPLLVLFKDGETVVRDVEMKAGLSLHGKVTDPSGAGVAGAKITSPTYGLGQLSWQWGVSYTGGAESLATTDADGAFRVTGLPPRDGWILVASKPPLSGLPSAMFRLVVGEPELDIALKMEVGATVAGRVLDGEGAPMVGKPVRWYSQDGARPGYGDTISGPDGTFRMEGVAPVQIMVYAWTATAGNASVNVESLKSGEVREGVELKFATAAKISGTVVDAEGKPVAGRYVLATKTDGERGSRTSRARTADDGTFELRDTVEGTWNLSLTRSNDDSDGGAWQGEGEAQTVKAPAEGVRIVAAPRKTTIVAGRILLADGSAVPLCVLKIASPNRGYNPGAQVANEVVGGEFRREFASGVPFEIAVSSVRGSTGAALNVLPKTVKITESVTDLVITLEAGGQISGRAIDASNGGVEGVTLSTGSCSAVSDATGAFCLCGLGAGDVSISVKAPQRYVSPPPVKASVGASDVVVRVNEGLSISGRVTGMEQVPGSTVQVSAQAGSNNANAQAGADGAFRLEGFAPDSVATVYVNAWSQSKDRSFRPIHLKGVRAGTEGLVLNLELGANVSGTIVDADGKPATGMSITVNDPEGRGYGAEMGNEGTFTIRGLTPGRIELAVQSQTDGRMRASGIKAEAPSKDVRIVLPRMQKLSGHLIGSDTKGFYVSITATTAGQPRNGASTGAATAADGTFSIDVPGEGPFRLTAQRSGDDRYALMEGVVLGSDVAVRLDIGASIEGTLEDAAGKPAGENSWIMFMSDRWNANAKVGTDGVFRGRGLLPGRYKIAYSLNGNYEMTTEEVEAGVTGLRLKAGQAPSR